MDCREEDDGWGEKVVQNGAEGRTAVVVMASDHILYLNGS